MFVTLIEAMKKFEIDDQETNNPLKSESGKSHKSHKHMELSGGKMLLQEFKHSTYLDPLIHCDLSLLISKSIQQTVR